MIKEIEAGGGTVRVTGSLDADDHAELRDALESALGSAPERLTVDLTGVEGLHSRPIAILCYAWVEAVKRHVEMEVVVSGGVERVLRDANLDQVFALRAAGG